MHRLFFAAVAAVASLAASAADWYDITDNVLTFNVTEGSQTYSDDIPATIVKIVKNGAGTVVIPAKTSFGGQKKPIQINAGILQCNAYGALGAYNEISIADKAQIYLNYYHYDDPYSAFPQYFTIEGSGPDGTGAIKSNDSAAYQNYYRNRITLKGDATIGMDGGQAGFGTGTTLELNGHTLTLEGTGGAFFNNCTVKPGHIVFNVTRSMCVVFQGSVLFEGDSSSTLTFNKTGTIQFWSMTNPLPWTITVNGECTWQWGQSLKDNAWSRDVNVVTGPVVMNAKITMAGNSSYLTPCGRVGTFKGGITRNATVKPSIYFGAGVPEVYFDFAEGAARDFGISMSNPCNCYFLNEHSIPTGYFSGPTGYGTYKTEVWAGGDYGSDAVVSEALARFCTFNGYTSSRRLLFRTFGDVTMPEDAENTYADYGSGGFEYAHDGTGTLTIGKKLTFTKNGYVAFRNVGDVKTVFNGGIDHSFRNLAVDSGTVEIADGAVVASGSNYRYTVGAKNDVGSATLVVKAGGRLVTPVANATSNIKVADTGACPAVLDIQPGGAVTNNIIGAQNAGEKTAIRQFGGDVRTLSAAGQDAYLAAGAGCGFYGFLGGRFSARVFTTLCGSPGGRGIFQQEGGTFAMDASTDGVYLSRGGEGEYLMKGGRLEGSGFFTLGAHQYNKQDVAGGCGIFSMHGEGNPVVDIPGIFYVTHRTNAFTSVLNLNAGTFSAKQILYGFRRSYFRDMPEPALNFNGGAFQFRTDSSVNLVDQELAPRVTTIYPNGGTVFAPEGANYWFSSKQGNADPVLVFRHATGKGLKSVKIPAGMPREGYKGIMSCKVIGGGGEGATVALDFDPATGTIAEDLLITCPGCDYAEAPRIIAYGPNYTTEYECVVELTDEAQELNPGRFYKTGPGVFCVNCTTNTFAGTYVISNGILKINANNRMSENASVFVAGGKFWFDWKSRTIKSIGGYGGFYGYKGDNNTYRLTVTGSLDFDAADLKEGRTLVMESDIGVNGTTTQTVDKDNLYLGDDCKVRISNVDQLPDGKASYTLLKVNIPLNRLPELENQAAIGDGAWKVRLAKGGKELRLIHNIGTFIYVR